MVEVLVYTVPCLPVAALCATSQPGTCDGDAHPDSTSKMSQSGWLALVDWSMVTKMVPDGNSLRVGALNAYG
jgi:hypothetical protein